jgi:hypothetical protein
MYRVPKITMTMLGATGCGKTTYLLGMYAVLSSGVNGYFLLADDPDADLDLAEAWEELCENGTLPEATSTEPVSHGFVFKHGMKTLLEIDCQDFRGGAGNERPRTRGPAAGATPTADAEDDVTLLRRRLDVSDTVVLALDGQHVARWIADGAPAGLDRAHDPMRIARLSMAISRVMEDRFTSGRPTPAIVVLVTKADQLDRLSGRSTRDALDVIMRNLFNLVPVLASEGATVMLCPVQIGRFDGPDATSVRPDQISPKNLHKPITFSLMHYLTEIIPRREADAAGLDRLLDEQNQELAAMRGKFLGGWFNRDRISRTESARDESRSALGAAQSEIAAARKWAEQTAEDLRSSPIYRSGKLQEG